MAFGNNKEDPGTGGTVVQLDDDVDLDIGTGDDYALHYDSANTRLEIESTDIDGSGTDGDVLRVEDGTDDVVLPGSLVLSGSAAPASAQGDFVVVDSNGITGGYRTTDTAPQGLMIRPQQAFAGGTQTAANLRLCGGQDETKIDIDDYTQGIAGDTVTITTIDNNGTSTPTTFTASTDGTPAAQEFEVQTSNAVTATNLAAAINTAAIGVTATASSAQVRLQLNPNIASVSLAESRAAFTTVAIGTRGYVIADSGVIAASPVGAAGNTWGLSSVGSAGHVSLTTTVGGTTTGFLYTSGLYTVVTAGSSTTVARTDITNGFMYGTASTFTLTAGTMTGNTVGFVRPAWFKFAWTNAMIAALGAGTTVNMAICTLPAKTLVKRCIMVVGTAATHAGTLTMSVGRTAAVYNDFLLAGDIKAAANTVYGDVQSEIGADLTGTAGVGLMDALPSYTGTTVVNAQFISTVADVNTTTTSTGIVYLQVELLP